MNEQLLRWVCSLASEIMGGRLSAEVLAADPTQGFSMDSMELVRLLVEVEDAQGIQFDPLRDDLSRLFSSPASLAGYLSSRAAEEA